MTKKVKISNLKINSFVTSLDDETKKDIQGKGTYKCATDYLICYTPLCTSLECSELCWP